MPRVEFELTILVFERAKTFHGLDRTATVIGHITQLSSSFFQFRIGKSRPHVLRAGIHGRHFAIEMDFTCSRLATRLSGSVDAMDI
jgi:hypothetical protein